MKQAFIIIVAIIAAVWMLANCEGCGSDRIIHSSYLVCSCGKKVFLHGFTNVCECGAMYNSFGQELAPVEQWDEEDRYDSFGPQGDG